MIGKLAILPLLLAAADHTFVSGTMLDIRPGSEHVTGYAVQVGNILYAGSCRDGLVTFCDTDFLVNAPVQVRIDGKSLYVVRHNGKELKITIYRRELLGPAKPPSVD